MTYIIIGGLVLIAILVIAIIYYRSLAKKRQAEKLEVIKENARLSILTSKTLEKNEDLQRQLRAVESVYEDNLKALKRYEKSKSNLEQALKMLNQEDYNKIRRYL